MERAYLFENVIMATTIHKTANHTGLAAR